MHTAVIALALTVLGGQDEPIRNSRKDQAASGQWRKDQAATRPRVTGVCKPDNSDPPPVRRVILPYELPGLLAEIGRIKEMMDDPRSDDPKFVAARFKFGTNLRIRLQDRSEELFYSDTPLGRFLRSGRVP
jgi:hypothetical protein